MLAQMEEPIPAIPMEPLIITPIEPITVVKKKRESTKQKKEELMSYHDLSSKSKINNEKLERTCAFYGIIYNEEKPKDSYKELKRIILAKFEPYVKNELSLVKIQKVFRGWNIRRRKYCNNKEDCGTMDLLYDIPIEYYIDYEDQDRFIYGFDIRSLHIIMNDVKLMNPFTQKQMITDGNFFEKYKKKIHFVKEKEGIVKFESPKLSKEQRFNQTLVRVFQKIDMLGHYTDIAWFQNMTLYDLKNFYKGAYDIFAYRAQLSAEVRKKIVKDGIIFSNFITSLNYIQERNKHILQYEILREIERILDEGEDRDNKILGITLVLTVLVECSYAAALALPHLVQSSFN